MPASVYQNGITNGIVGNNDLLAPGLVPGGIGSWTPSMQLSVNTVDAVTESIKSDRTIRMWKVEAMKVLHQTFFPFLFNFNKFIGKNLKLNNEPAICNHSSALEGLGIGVNEFPPSRAPVSACINVLLFALLKSWQNQWWTSHFCLRSEAL